MNLGSSTTMNRAPRTLVTAAVLVAGGCTHLPHTGSSQGATEPLVLARVEQQMIAAVVDTVAAHWPDSTSLCLTLMGGPEGPRAPSVDLLASLQARQRAVRGADCSPTYTQMVLHVDSAGRPIDPPPPAGYIDPYILHVSRPQFEQEGYAWIYVRQLQGTRGRAYVCVAQAHRRVFASCRAVDSWIH